MAHRDNQRFLNPNNVNFSTEPPRRRATRTPYQNNRFHRVPFNESAPNRHNISSRITNSSGNVPSPQRRYNNQNRPAARSQFEQNINRAARRQRPTQPIIRNRNNNRPTFSFASPQLIIDDFDNGESSSSSAVENFDESTIQPAVENFLNQTETDVCAICLCDKTGPALLMPCKHSFCLTCINQWLENQTTCPLCKEKSVRLVYNIVSQRNYQLKKLRQPVESIGRIVTTFMPPILSIFSSYLDSPTMDTTNDSLDDSLSRDQGDVRRSSPIRTRAYTSALDRRRSSTMRQTRMRSPISAATFRQHLFSTPPLASVLMDMDSDSEGDDNSINIYFVNGGRSSRRSLGSGYIFQLSG